MIYVQIVAMLLSPLIALQASRWLDRRKSDREQKLKMFHTLMATRGALGTGGRMEPAHVHALNMIDIEFHAKKYKAIREAWKAYLDHLNTPMQTSPEVWSTRRDDLMVDLLHVMALALGYDFDKTFIRRTTYAPQGYLDLDIDQFMLRKAVLQLVTGERALRISAESPTATQEPVSDKPALPGDTAPALGPGSAATGK
jgi:hypothetical protein